MWEEPIDKIEDILTLEERVLAGFLIAWQTNKRAFTDSLSILEPEDFQRDLHQLIFKAMLNLVDTRQEVAPLAITRWFDANIKPHGKELLRRWGGKHKSYLSEIITNAPDGIGDSLTKWAKRLKKVSLLYKAYYLTLKGNDASRSVKSILALDRSRGIQLKEG